MQGKLFYCIKRDTNIHTLKYFYCVYSHSTYTSFSSSSHTVVRSEPKARTILRKYVKTKSSAK